MIRAFLFTFFFLLQNVASSFDCSELICHLATSPGLLILFRMGKMLLRGNRVETGKQSGVVARGLASADQHSAQGC